MAKYHRKVSTVQNTILTICTESAISHWNLFLFVLFNASRTCFLLTNFLNVSHFAKIWRKHCKTSSRFRKVYSVLHPVVVQLRPFPTWPTSLTTSNHTKRIFHAHWIPSACGLVVRWSSSLFGSRDYIRENSILHVRFSVFPSIMSLNQLGQQLTDCIVISSGKNVFGEES